MAINDHVKLKGVTNIGGDLLNKQLKYGLSEYFKWSLLNIGAFQNISLGQQNVRSGDLSRLRLAKDPSYADGRVWEGYRSDWVWETGVSSTYVNEQPIQISGVYIGGVFYPSNTTGAQAHIVDYPNGRIIFDTAIATNSVVKAEFSHRTVNVLNADVPWFRELMFDSDAVDRYDFLRSGSGNWSQHPLNRYQLPAVGIEIVPRRRSTGYQLGGGQVVHQDVMFHIISANADDRDQLVDIFAYQKYKTIFLPDKNRLKLDRAMPLDYRGMKVTNPKTYPQIVAPTGVGGYRWNKLYFADVHSQEMGQINPKLFGAIVRATTEVILHSI